MALLKKDIKDKRILKLIRMMLKAGVLEELELLRTELGTPPGGILSPLLANIYLHELDKLISSRYEDLDPYRRKKAPLKIFICRYADDWCILIKGTREQAELVKLEVTEFLLETLKLELSEEKTLITPVEKGVDFLGFNIRKYRDAVHVKPTLKALRKLRDKVREITKTFFAMDLDLGIMKLNYALRGFAEYYRRVYSKRIFRKLDFFIWWHVLR
jgi:RNA-directed DNA polymerase